MSYLNLGCGQRFHPDWTNVNFTATSEGVIAHNLTQGIPFSEHSFDVVYHSHILEHFSKTDAQSFMQECFRVLRPKGTIRVVVPDLEQIVRTYLFALEQAKVGSDDWDANYEWITLELYDQTVRNCSGGNMTAYLHQQVVPNVEFVLSRCGKEAKDLIEAGHLSQELLLELSPSPLKSFLRHIYHLIRYPSIRREKLLKLFLGQEYQALQIGRFRLNGEVHQWMYDQYSLTKLLHQCGFQQIIQRTANESSIPDWVSFCLDTDLDGSVYKPDSLFMEAIKPALDLNE